MSKTKKFSEKAEQQEEPKSETEQKTEGEKGLPLTFKEFYPVNPPFGYVGVKAEKQTGRLQYLVIEPSMDENEKETLTILKKMVKAETDVPLAVLKNEALIEKYLREQIGKAIKSFRLDISKDSWGTSKAKG